MPLHDKQREIASSTARFKVVRAGRRSGKTILKQETVLFKAIAGQVDRAIARAVAGRAVIFIAPTQKQARAIVWEAFKSRLGKVGEYNESRLEIKLRTEDGEPSTIFVGGWENRENYRGMPNVFHLEFDELDTMKDFFIAWQEIFRPMLIDTGGSAGFGGTPKKENPNLRRLEKEAEGNPEWACFHFTTYDNPHVDPKEIEAARETMDPETFRQEILAEYVDHAGALFKYTAILDMFTNTVDKPPQKYLTVDIADDGSDKTIFTFWQGLTVYKIVPYAQLLTDGIISQIREDAAAERIPYSHIAVDAIGVGAGVASSPLLAGIIGFKSSYAPIRNQADPVKLPNVHYTKTAPLTSEYKNLRSQCVFTLASLVNDHKLAILVEDARIKSHIIEELSNYQDASKGDGKRMATAKEDVKTAIGRSPDLSDTLIMRMYFHITGGLLPDQSEQAAEIADALKRQFSRNEGKQGANSSR